MSKRNYGYEKRQKELQRQHKQEQKRQRKLDRHGALSQEENANAGGATTAEVSGTGISVTIAATMPLLMRKGQDDWPRNHGDIAVDERHQPRFVTGAMVDITEQWNAGKDSTVFYARISGHEMVWGCLAEPR